MNKVCVINNEASEKIKNRIYAAGYDIIEVFPNFCLPEPEMCHADMQFARINSKTAVYSPSTDARVIDNMSKAGIKLYKGMSEIQNKYPLNIAYNVLVGTQVYFHNMKYTDSMASQMLQKEGIVPINTKQGYAGCSSIILNDIFITSDYGMAKAAKSCNFHVYVLKDSKMIKLSGYDHGFIGGCCGFDGQNLLITGSVNNLNLIDYDDKYTVIPFSSVVFQAKINIISLNDSFPQDVGGLQLYNI